MSRPTRALLTITGAIIFGAWGFRLSVLFRHWETDPFAFIHLVHLLISVGIGAFFFRVGLRGDRATASDHAGVMLGAVFTVIVWGNRWIGLITGPTGSDTRERAHLHLASLFLVLGGLLFTVGWRGWRRIQKQAAATASRAAGGSRHSGGNERCTR